MARVFINAAGASPTSMAAMRALSGHSLEGELHPARARPAVARGDAFVELRWDLSASAIMV